MYGFLLALVAALLFGASTPASKWLLGDLDPFGLAGLLYLGAALAMGPTALRQRRAGVRPKLDRTNRLRLAGAVLFGGALGPVLLLFGLRLSLAGSVSLLLNLELVATALLGVLWFGEHLGRAGWAGVGGVVAAGLILGGSGGWPGALSALLVAAACVCWGLDNQWTALIDGMTPARTTLWKGLVAGSVNLALGAASQGFAPPPVPALAALGVGALAYGASIAFYIAAAQAIGATRAQGVFAVAPFAGAALAFTGLGESPGAEHAVAAALLALSIALLVADPHGHRHVHESLEHVHGHRHDDGHHLHDHPGLSPATRHTHRHAHERLLHSHPHWPDLHHRHEHD